MYRIVVEDRSIRPGVWRWQAEVNGATVEGLSHQPLLDGCRVIKRAGGDPKQYAGTYRNGREAWDLRCKVGWGADHTVLEPSKGSIRLGKWQEWHGQAAH